MSTAGVTRHYIERIDALIGTYAEREATALNEHDASEAHAWGEAARLLRDLRDDIKAHAAALANVRPGLESARDCARGV